MRWYFSYAVLAAGLVFGVHTYLPRIIPAVGTSRLLKHRRQSRRLNSRPSKSQTRLDLHHSHPTRVSSPSPRAPMTPPGLQFSIISPAV